MLAQSTRPKCKADTYYLPMPDGVYLRGNNSRLVLKGKSLYPLLEHLIPNLNGTVTLEELTGDLDVERKRMITHLIEKLFAHQFLKDASLDQLHTLHPSELETYAPDITFIESFQTSAAYRFECFRNKRLLIIGTGSGLTSLAQASLQCGLRKINALIAPEEENAVDLTQNMLALFSHDASELIARLVDAPAWDNEAEVRKAIQDYDAVLSIAEEPMLARAQLLNRLCIEQQKTYIQAIVVDDCAWIGPLVTPENGSCWECAWRRLQANLANVPGQLSHYEFRDQLPAANGRSLAAAGASVIANRLLFELFQYFTQTNATEAAGKLSVLDLATHLSESHTFLPHPQCMAHQHAIAPDASQFLAHIQELQQRHPGDPDGLLEKIAPCIDEKLGLFTALDTSNFVQIPLAVYRAQLSNPMLETLTNGPCSVFAVGTDTNNTLTRAAQKACEHYAANLLDQRRLLSAETVQQSSLAVISPAQLVGTQPFAAAEGLWTWALDLHTQQTSLVPAAHVFASLGEQTRGIGSGQTWEEALCQALLDWCNDLTIAQLQTAGHAYPQLDLASMPMKPEGEHLYKLLKATESQVTIYDVTGALRVPTFALCLDGKVVTYSTHCDEAQALRLGLERVLQQYQAEQFQQPDYAPVPVADLPARLRGDQLSVPNYTLPGAWPVRLAWLLERLQASGLQACVVPLDHDPALEQVLPFIVRVLLSKRELERGE